jgi:hypothetical protein
MGNYNSFTAETKGKVIKFAEQNGIHAAEREFSVNKAYIRCWHKQEVLCKAKCSVRAFWDREPENFLNLKRNYLFKYSDKTQNNGNAVSHKILQLRACETAQSLNIVGNEFKVCRGWIDRFMKQNTLSLRGRLSLCQKLPTDFTKSSLFTAM